MARYGTTDIKEIFAMIDLQVESNEDGTEPGELSGVHYDVEQDIEEGYYTRNYARRHGWID